MCRISTRQHWSTSTNNKTKGGVWWIFIAWLLLLSSPKVLAQDMSSIYDVSTLRQWQPINRADILLIYQHDFVSNLTIREKQVLRDVKIKFPLMGPEKGVFEFYADPSTSTIYLPIQSIRFFSDLALADAWLVENGYSVSTVRQYIGMLKYKLPLEFSGNRYPKPLEALRIPGNAKDNARVSKIKGNALTSGIMFLLGHELGHIYYRHPSYDRISSKQARMNEVEADNFAIELMSRMGQIPGGATSWFTYAVRLQMQRYDFPTKAKWEDYIKSSTHPLTPERMHNLSNVMLANADRLARTQLSLAFGMGLVRSIANDTSGIAGILEDIQIHQVCRREGLCTELKMLAPRCTDYYIPSEVSSDEGIVFSGMYKGKITSDANPDGVEIIVVLRRNRKYISGSYSYFVVKGMLRGIIQDERLYFEWSDAESSGKGVFHSTENGNGFRGTWGLQDSRDNGGTWEGNRF